MNWSAICKKAGRHSLYFYGEGNRRFCNLCQARLTPDEIKALDDAIARQNELDKRELTETNSTLRA